MVAEELAGRTLGLTEGAQFELLGSCSGSELAASGAAYRHPFIDREGILVTADYVTLEDGTGLVHTAPGHGAEDYYTGIQAGLPIYCPVLGDGTFDETVPDWLVGIDVWKACHVQVMKSDKKTEIADATGGVFKNFPIHQKKP